MASGGFLSGAFSGALAGGAVGGPVGAAVGFFAGGVLSSEQEDAAQAEKKKAQAAAEKARIASITNQMGAQKQAESTVFAGVSKSTKGNTTQQTPGGFLGSNLPTSAGTFGQG